MPPSLDGARAVLTNRYGPLPGYAWLGIAAGATFLYMRRRGGGGDAAPSTSPQDGGGGNDARDSVDYGPGADTSSYLPPGTPTGSVMAPPVAKPVAAKAKPVANKPTGPNGATSRHMRVYTVRRGDTIQRIAAMFHTTRNAIVKQNPNLKHPTRLRVGQVLVIP